MLSLLLLVASGAANPGIAQDIHAEPASLLVSTHGLVREARPVLGYDLQALASYAARDAGAPIRLGYAGFDQPGHGAEWPELRAAHQIAADIVRDGVEAPAGR